VEREKAKRDIFKDLEGLFQDGSEDAYSLRDGEDDPRLHDHVESEDACLFARWREIASWGTGKHAINIP